MKLTHKFVFLGLCLNTVACGGVDKKSEDAAEATCELAAECSELSFDENECISERLDLHAEIKDDYGSDCLDKYLDFEGCVLDQITCESAEDAETDGIEFLSKCSDYVGDFIDKCGLDFNIDDDFDFGGQ